MSASLAGQPPEASAAQRGPSPPYNMLPEMAVSQFHLAINVHELVLVLGRMRPFIDPKTGQPSNVPVLEWFAAANISPAAGKLLHEALGEALQQYEKKFGSIPTDRNARLLVSDPGSRPAS